MKLTKQYLRFLLYRYQAHQWLRACGPVVAAWCMFRLNRHARYRRYATGQIYVLKNSLIRHLYQAGYCVSATKQRQDQKCWNCMGSGEHWDGDFCYKCDGTGIYRSHLLYLFRFDVDGRRFSWHQPASLVDWPVELSEAEPGEYRSSLGDDDDYLEFDLLLLYVAVVYQYLRGQGAKELPKITLWQSLRGDLRKFNPYRRLKFWVDHLARALLDRMLRFLAMQTEVRVGDVAMTKFEPRRLVRVLEVHYGSSLLGRDEAVVETLTEPRELHRWLAYRLRPVQGLRWPVGVVTEKLERLERAIAEDEIPF